MTADQKMRTRVLLPAHNRTKRKPRTNPKTFFEMEKNSGFCRVFLLGKHSRESKNQNKRISSRFETDFVQEPVAIFWRLQRSDVSSAQLSELVHV